MSLFSHYILTLTNRCNQMCKYCYEQELTELFNGDMSDSVLHSSAEKIVEATCETPVVVDFFGGEPLLRFDLIQKFVEIVAEKHLPNHVSYTITTNGTLLDNLTLGWLSNHKFSIIIALDGPQNIHDKNRVACDGNGTWYQVISNIRRLRHFAIPWSVIATLTRNGLSPSEVCRYFFNLKIPKVTLHNVFNTSSTSFMWRDEDKQKIEEEVQKLGILYENYLLNDLGPWTIVQPVIEMIYRYITGNKKTMGCTGGLKSIVVSPNGAIYPCQRLIGYSPLTLGNIEKQIWTIDKTKLWKQITEMNSWCARCNVHQMCSNSCFYKAIYVSQEDFTPYKVACYWYKTLAYEAQRIADKLFKLNHPMARLMMKKEEAVA